MALAAEKKHYNGLIIGMGEGLGKAYTYLFINVNRPLGQHTCTFLINNIKYSVDANLDASDNVILGIYTSKRVERD